VIEAIGGLEFFIYIFRESVRNLHAIPGQYVKKTHIIVGLGRWQLFLLDRSIAERGHVSSCLIDMSDAYIRMLRHSDPH